MPLEGHYRRVNTPLRSLTRRERRVVIWGTLVTVVAVLALILATAGSSQPGPAAGCIRASIAGRTGAELIQRCGAEAVATCRQARGYGGPTGEAILAACDSANIEF
jgi:stage V sporulation protein SpoVS